MKALAALRTKKVLVEPGAWHSGNVTKAEFPLAHVTKLKLSKAWHWCVHKVQDDEREYRVLVAFEPMKSQYWAWLGVTYGSDQAVIARVEFHASHDGWHCHWKTGPLAEVSRGAVKSPHGNELRHGCSGEPKSVTKSEAFGLAYRLFNVAPPAGELGL
jgi:hypothetical protein